MKATESRTYNVANKTSLEVLSGFLSKLGTTPEDIITLYGNQMRRDRLGYPIEYRMWVENLNIAFQDRPDGKYAAVTGKYVEQARCNRKGDGDLWYPGDETKIGFTHTAKVSKPVITAFPDSPLQFRELELEELASLSAQISGNSERTLVGKVYDWVRKLVA